MGASQGIVGFHQSFKSLSFHPFWSNVNKAAATRLFSSLSKLKVPIALIVVIHSTDTPLLVNELIIFGGKK